jgi:hypothetical protein
MPLNHHHSFFIVWRMQAATAQIFPASAEVHWILEGAQATAAANVAMQATIMGSEAE